MIYSKKTYSLFILLSLMVVLNTGCSGGGSGDNSNPTGVEGTLKGTLNSARPVNTISMFSTPQNIYSPAIDSHCPVTTASVAEKVYAAYKGDSRIYLAEIGSATVLPSSPREISSPDSVSPSCPEIGVSSDGQIYVVWSDDGGIWVAISNDNGQTFPTIKDISTATGTSSSPKMAMAGTNVNLVWVEEETGMGDIFFSSSTDNGNNFSTPKNLSGSSSRRSMNPVITTDESKNISVAWTEGDEGSREIYFIRF